MHIESKDVEAFIERRARQYHKDFQNLSSGEQYACKYGVAVTVIWDVIMDLEPEIRAKRIKQMKK